MNKTQLQNIFKICNKTQLQNKGYLNDVTNAIDINHTIIELTDTSEEHSINNTVPKTQKYCTY